MIRAGVVVPGANRTVEPELYRLLPPDVSVYVARLSASGDLRERLAGYRDDTAALTQLSGLGLRGALIACTGASYPLGVASDREWTIRAEQHLGAPVVTAARALADALAVSGATHLHLVSPYPQWLTEQCVGFWNAAGYPVERVWNVHGNGTIYDTTPADVRVVIESALAETSPGTGCAVVVSGTGAPSLAALDALAEISSVPVLSSNLAGAWALTRMVGGSPGMSPSPALRRLADATGGPA